VRLPREPYVPGEWALFPGHDRYELVCTWPTEDIVGICGDGGRPVCRVDGDGCVWEGHALCAIHRHLAGLE
jgi:hypothetical protein